jgi:tetratricopeptide (TPR) repeat protein
MSADEAAGATAGGVRGLVRALSLAEGFSLYLVVTPYAKHLTAVRQAAIDGGVAAGEVFNPYRISSAGPGLADDWPAATVEQMLRTGTSAAEGPLWMDLTAAPGPTNGSESSRDDDGWAAVFHALNLGRNAIAKRLNRPLVVFLPHRLSQLLAAEAPDLWSVRSAVVVLPAEVAVQPNVDELPQLLADLPVSVSSGEELERALAQVDLARKRLAQDQAAVHVIALASALGVAAGRLLFAGRRLDALELATECEALWRRLHLQQPHRFAPELARSLSNLATAQASMGTLDRAIESGRELIAILSGLQANRPGEFESELAHGHENLASNLVHRAGPSAESLQATRQAVHLYRNLARTRPETYLPNLATGLHNLGAQLLMLGKPTDAPKYAQEAVEIQRGLAAQHPNAASPLLPVALILLGAALVATDQLAQSLAATREAVELLRGLASSRPGAHDRQLCQSLVNLSAIESQLGHFDQAFASAGEALRLAIGDPLANREDFKRTLANWLSSYLAAAAQAGASADTALVAAVQARLGLAGAPAQKEA